MQFAFQANLRVKGELFIPVDRASVSYSPCTPQPLHDSTPEYNLSMSQTSQHCKLER